MDFALENLKYVLLGMVLFSFMLSMYAGYVRDKVEDAKYTMSGKDEEAQKNYLTQWVAASGLCNLDRTEERLRYAGERISMDVLLSAFSCEDDVEYGEEILSECGEGYKTQLLLEKGEEEEKEGRFYYIATLIEPAVLEPDTTYFIKTEKIRKEDGGKDVCIQIRIGDDT